MRADASLAAVAAAVQAHGDLVRVSVIRAEGSTPRETGAAMLVAPSGLTGTIGGGTLELEAIRLARAMLRPGAAPEPWRRDVHDFALGPSLGQCCGGATRLLLECWGPREAPALAGLPDRALVLRSLESGMPPTILMSRKEDAAGVPLPVLRVARDMLSGARPRQAELVRPGKGVPSWLIEPSAYASTPLFIYGAGHVGRAIVHVLQGLPLAVHWVDTARERFPELVPEDIRMIPAADPANVAAIAPAGAFHLVLTFSHALDLAIVHVLLKRNDAAFVGLIGSETKSVRFRKRLRASGITDAALAHLTCPIGIGGLTGKEPPVIAVSVAAQLISLLEAGAMAGTASAAEAADA
jgi:xanthine dehydrogenase accessory factor